MSQNPTAIHLLERNKLKINWHGASENPAATHLLGQNEEKNKMGFFICLDSRHYFVVTPRSSNRLEYNIVNRSIFQNVLKKKKFSNS